MPAQRFGGFRRTTGDADNFALVLGLPESNKSFHIAGTDDMATDWAVAAPTDPTLFIHSDATPADNYLRIFHTGTTATLDSVSGATLRFMFDGTIVHTITTAGPSYPAGADLTFTGATGTNDIVLTDALADALSITDGTADVMVFDTSTAGNIITFTARLTTTAGDIRSTAGNLRLGVVSTFATTEPTEAVVLKTGTAPSGAIATSSGIFASSTVMRKIIADGTASNVET